MPNYVKILSIFDKKWVFDFEKRWLPPPKLTPIPHKKKTLPISEEGQGLHP